MDWNSFLSACVGGGFTLVGVFLAQQLARKQDREQSNGKKETAAHAVLFRLADMAVWARLVKSAIHGAFDEAQEAGLGALPPGIKVKPMAGLPSLPDRLSDSERRLILELGDQGLLERVLLLEHRLSSQADALNMFNKDRKEFQSFYLEHSIATGEMDGTLASATVPKELKHHADVREAVLNNTLGQIFEGLEPDIVDAKAIAFRFLSAANSHDAISLPSIKFQDEV